MDKNSNKINNFLYRGKRKDNGEWVHGNLLVLDSSEYRIATSCISGDDKDLLTVCAYEVCTETVSQCVGCEDKTGRLVFGGDIVQTKTGRLYEIYWLELPDFYGWGVSPVRNRDNIFKTKKPDDYDFYLKENLLVVGNIHDNPELLKD